jgi:NAD(P)-dependent dehydrogenase (short-subunit alcohol dehydrogenase family)
MRCTSETSPNRSRAGTAKEHDLSRLDLTGLINTASIGGMGFEAGLGIYNASKAALIHLTKQLALELSPKVRVNVIRRLCTPLSAEGLRPGGLRLIRRRRRNRRR